MEKKLYTFYQPNVLCRYEVYLSGVQRSRRIERIIGF